MDSCPARARPAHVAGRRFHIRKPSPFSRASRRDCPRQSRSCAPSRLYTVGEESVAGERLPDEASATRLPTQSLRHHRVSAPQDGPYLRICANPARALRDQRGARGILRAATALPNRFLQRYRDGAWRARAVDLRPPNIPAIFPLSHSIGTVQGSRRRCPTRRLCVGHWVTLRFVLPFVETAFRC